MRVIFHGHLQKLCPVVHDMKVDSPYEALTALVAQIPVLQIVRGGQGYPCRVVGFRTPQALMRRSDVEEIHVMPDYTVAGKAGSWIQIGIGAILVAVGAYTGNAFLINAGVALIMGGILQLLAPSPNKDGNPDASKYLGAPKNTVAMGTRIIIAYGVNRLYGQFLSYDVNVIGVPVAGE
ncbi:tail assembly protein [Azospirillum cavernae]|uniref:Tail assembly protein n=1 Tax=Azospirillum cavernae TaxID=2320860 RepID=A0A418VP65_9PROT|nr:tail assembly protein [Azospirillum cavernae]RJF78072.1 tail assembly protein [Azospirillum cavernae]